MMNASTMLAAAERDLSDCARFTYCQWLVQRGMALGLDNAMGWMKRCDAQTSSRLIWC